MALNKIPTQIEVDKLCDSFVKDFCSQSKKFTPAEAHKIAKLVRQLSTTYTEDGMTTAIERFESKINTLYWVMGAGIALIGVGLTILGLLITKSQQPTQNPQPPVQQQQVLPPVQQPVQPQQTVEPAEQSGQTVLP